MAKKSIRRITDTRSPYQKTSPRYYSRRGFLKPEQYWLSEISIAGRNAPYIKAMVRTRISLNANRKKYNWTTQEFVKRIYREYLRRGVRPKRRWESYADYFKKVFYDYLGWWKDHKDIFPGGDDWETPRRKSRKPSKVKPKAQRSRRDMLLQQISDYNDKINRAISKGDQRERAILERQRNNLQNRLDSLR